MFEKVRRRLILFFALTVSLTGSQTFAQDQPADQKEAETPKPKVEMLECRVKVVDPDGFPVEEATVFCTGLRSREERGSHWGWTEERFGPNPRIKTDAEGIATMPYPKMLSDEFTTGTMTWSVEHPSFVNYRKDHSVDDDPAKIELERGFRIALTAKRASSGEKIKENLHAVASFAGGGKWELKKNGMLVSSVMKKQDGILRVVCFDEGQPTLFSDEIKIEPGDKSRLLLKDIELSIGCRLEGSISDSIPRPIQNGHVIACIFKKMDPQRWDSTWGWSDQAKINEDGTFVFESLPGDEAVQLIPVCDNWAPAKPQVEQVVANISVADPTRLKGTINHFSAVPTVLKLNDDESSVTLDLVKAPKIKVKVVDADGNPVSGIMVGTSPNQFWFNAGSQIYGSSYGTREMWELQEKGEDLMSFYRSQHSNYYKATEEDGTVVFSNMPPGNQQIAAGSDDLEMRKDLVSNSRERRIEVRDRDRTVTIRMYPKGSLDDADQKPFSEIVTELWDQISDLIAN